VGPNQVGTIDAVNSRYAFQLRRLAPDKPWAFVGQDLNLEEARKPGPLRAEVGVQNWTGYPFLITGIACSYLPDLIEDADFSVQSATPVVRDRNTLVRVEFTTRPKLWRRKLHPNITDWMNLHGGWILFDPMRYWIIREFQVKVHTGRPQSDDNSTSVTKGKFDYKEGQDGFPILTRIARQWEQYQVENIQEFQLIERDDVPESEFTLTAFGFPEPADLQTLRSGPRLYLWAGGAGILCLALGVVFRWRKPRVV
jgi:hypothetical protein